MSYKLKDDGFPYLKIYHGKKWIGRVYKNAQGLWVCQIGTKTYHTGRTSEEAFHEGTARYMGYSSLAALRDSNRRIKERNAATRSRGKELARRYMSATSLEERMDAIEAIADAVFPQPKQGAL